MTSAAFWDNIAEKYSRDPISDMDAYTETLNRMKDILQPHHRVVEIGCGTGTTALDLAPLVDQYTGTDISKNMIEIAKDKRKSANIDHLQFNVASADTQFKPQPDVVIALNLLHLVPDPAGHIRQIFAALPSGGLFVSKTALLKDGPWFLRPAIAIMSALGKAPYCERLSQSENEQMIIDAGFEITEQQVQGGLAPRQFIVARKP